MAPGQKYAQQSEKITGVAGMIPFMYHVPTAVHFGTGAVEKISSIIPEMGRRVMLVGGGDASRLSHVVSLLEKSGVAHYGFIQQGEPTIDQALCGAQQARDEKIDVVLAVGGGSVLDVGKAIAALAVNPGDPLQYLEVIGEGKPLTTQPLPLVAIPTTAGTGAEVTMNSVLAAPDHGVKVSLRSPWMAPDAAIVDPALTISVPPRVTAFSGMDALTQLMEAFISRFATPVTDALCREGIKQVAASLVRCCDCGEDVAAREGMSLAALLSGIVLSHAKLGVVHGIAGPMGGMVRVAHGAVCARLLGPGMAANLKQSRIKGVGQVVGKLDETARLLTGQPGAVADDAVDWIHQMTKRLQVPPLSACGLSPEQMQTLCRRALKSSSMKGNPVPLSEAELMDVLLRG